MQAQRLVRRLCPKCSVPDAPPLAAVQASITAWVEDDAPAGWCRAVGCPACQGTGYLGRLGIYELVDVSPAMQELVMQAATAERMREQADREGARTLRVDGLLKARQGLTTVEEVARVTGGMPADA